MTYRCILRKGIYGLAFGSFLFALLDRPGSIARDSTGSEAYNSPDNHSLPYGIFTNVALLSCFQQIFYFLTRLITLAAATSPTASPFSPRLTLSFQSPKIDYNPSQISVCSHVGNWLQLCNEFLPFKKSWPVIVSLTCMYVNQSTVPPTQDSGSNSRGDKARLT
jgi:hypothetical protein